MYIWALSFSCHFCLHPGLNLTPDYWIHLWVIINVYAHTYWIYVYIYKYVHIVRYKKWVIHFFYESSRHSRHSFIRLVYVNIIISIQHESSASLFNLVPRHFCLFDALPRGQVGVGRLHMYPLSALFGNIHAFSFITTISLSTSRWLYSSHNLHLASGTTIIRCCHYRLTHSSHSRSTNNTASTIEQLG